VLADPAAERPVVDLTLYFQYDTIISTRQVASRRNGQIKRRSAGETEAC